MQLTTDNRILQHVAAFALAWIAASFLFIYVLRPITAPQPQPAYHMLVLGKGEAATRNLIYLSGALRGGQTIVMLGSSELDSLYSTGVFTPATFFPAHQIAPVMTYGKPGFDTLGMYWLLYALKPHLNAQTRLVIMLSPAWFRTSDMLPSAFNGNTNDNVLLQIYMSDDPRGVMHDYLTAHQADFAYMTATQRIFLGDPASIIDWNLPGYIVDLINTRAYAQRVKLNMRLEQIDQISQFVTYGSMHAQDLPWDDYEKDARAKEVGRMTNNKLMVRNGFYNQITKKFPKFPISYFPKNLQPEPEMNALKQLLQLLQRSKVKALFVMQTVNPHIYDDHAIFKDVDVRVANLCREYDMQYVDMYAMPFEQGLLRDGSHPGELG
ncbi:MAG: D-alanyl-lipoteichoic acid biosynthesis protein DltD, partial [Gammaproteobacteria bacterium]